MYLRYVSRRKPRSQNVGVLLPGHVPEVHVPRTKPQLIPTPKTCERLILDFREERRELSPLCPEVCGACPREGVTSQAPAGPSPGPHGTRSRPCWHPGGFGASPAREDDQISACGRPVRSLTLTTKTDPSGLPHTSHTASRKRRGAERLSSPFHGEVSHRDGWAGGAKRRRKSALTRRPFDLAPLGHFPMKWGRNPDDPMPRTHALSPDEGPGPTE